MSTVGSESQGRPRESVPRTAQHRLAAGAAPHAHSAVPSLAQCTAHTARLVHVNPLLTCSRTVCGSPSLDKQGR